MSKYTLSKYSLKTKDFSQGFSLQRLSFQGFSLILLWGAILAQPVVGQNPPKRLRTLTVRGQGVEEIAATLSQINLGVGVQGKIAQEVQQEAARRSQAVVRILQSQQVEKLTTSGISLNPVYSFKDNIRRITGYSATNTVSFQIATEKAGEILDQAVKSGATRIDGIRFIAPEAMISEAKKQALKEATQDAREQADAVLASLGLSSKEIVGIEVDNARAQVPPIFRGESAFAQSRTADAPRTPIIGGEQKVEATVTLQISY